MYQPRGFAYLPQLEYAPACIIIIVIDNRGLNARWYLTPFLLSLPTAAYLGQRGSVSYTHLTLPTNREV